MPQREIHPCCGGMPPFRRRVVEVVRSIPRGEVRSYGWVARAAGSHGVARAVGTAMAANRLLMLVPCHRVVGHDGTVRNYARGSDERVRLLEAEGVLVDYSDGVPRVRGSWNLARAAAPGRGRRPSVRP